MGVKRLILEKCKPPQKTRGGDMYIYESWINEKFQNRTAIPLYSNRTETPFHSLEHILLKKS